MRALFQKLSGIGTAAAILALAGCHDGSPITAPEDLSLSEDAALRQPLLNDEDRPQPPALPPYERERVYHVTIENLTSGQPFSRALFATHQERIKLFELGTSASEGIRLLAEEGDPTLA